MTKTVPELIGSRVKEIRRIRGLTQAELSERVGVDPKHLSRIELGKNNASLKVMGRISCELGVEMKDLLDFQHLAEKKEVMMGIQGILKNADEENLRLYYKLLKALVN